MADTALNPLGYGNSPYQPYSSYAGDELYISLELLAEAGLLKELPEPFRTEEKRVDYEAVRAFKQPVLRTAYQSFKEKKQDEDPEYQAFAALDWVKTYTAFRALKKANGGVCWNEWKAEDQNFPEGERELTGEEQEEAGFHTFLQYIFYCQWMKVKTAANEKGIRIMGMSPSMWDWIRQTCGEEKITSFWTPMEGRSLSQESRLIISVLPDSVGAIRFMTGST